MKHNSTSRRGGESTTGDIPIHHIHVGDGDDADSGNGADDDGDSIVSSSSFSYWGCATNQTKEEILQHRFMCAKSKHGPEGSRERNICYCNATKALSHNFGAAKHFIPKNSEGEYESTKYTNIKSEYVGKLDKIKLLEARIMAYNMRDPFVILKLVD